MFKELVLQEIKEYKLYCTEKNADEGLFMILGVIRMLTRLELITPDFMEYTIDLVFKEHSKITKN
jgi:hypothetical protein